MSQKSNRRKFGERKADAGMRIDDFPVGLFVVQGDRFAFVSSCLPDLLGYAGPEELLEKSLCELIHPDDRGLVRSGMENEPDQESECVGWGTFSPFEHSRNEWRIILA